MVFDGAIARTLSTPGVSPNLSALDILKSSARPCHYWFIISHADTPRRVNPLCFLLRYVIMNVMLEAGQGFLKIEKVRKHERFSKGSATQ